MTHTITPHQHRQTKSPLALLGAIVAIASAIATTASSGIGWWVARETSKAITNKTVDDIVEDVKALEEADVKATEQMRQHHASIMAELQTIALRLERVLGRLEEQDRRRTP